MKFNIRPFSTALLLLAFVSTVRADFVSDSLRDDTKGFPSFFLTRLENWTPRFSKFRDHLSALEAEYINTFNKTITKFGIRKTDGFLRAVDYKIRLKGRNPYQLETVRLFDLENRIELRRIALRLLKKIAPQLDVSFLENKEMGFGFGRKDADIEIIFWEENLTKSPQLANYPSLIKQLGDQESGEIVLSIKHSKVISAEVIQLGKAPPASVTCPAATVFNQTDRVLYDDGTTSWVWHLDHFEDLAISPNGRSIYENLWRGLNLNPGAIDWRSKDDYTLSYP